MFRSPARFLPLGLLVLASHACAGWTLVQTDLRTVAIHETGLYQPEVGQRFAIDDIVETPSGGGVQLQDEAGNIVALGGDTRVLLARDAQLALLQGWMKVLRACNTEHCAAPVVETARTKLTPGDGAALVIAAAPDGYADAEADAVFSESGTASLLALTLAGARGKPAAVQLPMHQFAVRRAASPVIAIAASPDAAFVAAMPVAFRDALHALPLPKAVHDKPPGNMRPVAYDDVSDWLESALAVRTQPGSRFTERFRSRLSDAAFRRAIDQHLHTLPEWRVLLYPAPPRVVSHPSSYPSSYPAPRSAPATVPSVYRSMFARP
jgi:hypothetical protein